MINKMLKNKYILVAAAGVLTASVLGGCSKNTVQAKKEIPKVNIISASKGSIGEAIEYSSKLVPLHEVNVSPKVSGKITELNISLGSHVNQGDVLFKLDSKDLEASLHSQQAGLYESQTALSETQGSAIDQQVIADEQALKTAELTLETAQTSYNDANTKFQRSQTLYNSGSISKSDYDDAQSKLTNAGISLKNASAALDTAKKSLELLNSEAAPQSIDVAAAKVEQAQAGVESAQIQVDNSVVSSPISGTVSQCNLEVGEMVSNASPSLTLIDTSYMIAEVDIPDKMLSKVKLGDTLPVKIDTMEDKEIDGIVDKISPAADSKTQSYTVKVKIPNSDDTLKSGMFARVSLTGDKKDNALLVPNEAIQIENTVPYIYLDVKGKVKKAAVTTGLSDDAHTEVTKGISDGDEVITNGQVFLNEDEEISGVTAK